MGVAQSSLEFLDEVFYLFVGDFSLLEAQNLIPTTLDLLAVISGPTDFKFINSGVVFLSI